MAHIEYDGFDEVLKKLEKLSKKAEVDEIAKKAVDAAKDVVVRSTKAAISVSSIAGSIEPTEAKINSYGAYSVARPVGRDRKGTRFGERAAILEYGRYSGGKDKLGRNIGYLEAHPWRSVAISNATEPAKKIIEEYLHEEMELE